MISVLATNIVSPLGFTTDENYRAVREYRSKLARYDGWRGIPEPFVASIFDAEQQAELTIDGYTHFESVAIRSIRDAISRCELDTTSPRTIFILSTTKANVDELDTERYLSPGASARKIADYFSFVNEPIVVCNACVSGADAQLLALRLLSNGLYDRAVVCGADVVSPFVVAGFLSFKSLSLDECRPFDIERTGLNLGEAAATIIYGCGESNDASQWQLCSGAMSNDAYHASAPSPVGDGTCRVLSRLLPEIDIEDLAQLNLHGTATMFNDQMESKAINRSALTEIPISALKGYYGHTLGAAGILEAIITMRAMDDNIVLGVRGFEEIGVSGKLNISPKERSTDRHTFMKLISGFGGCNCALYFAKQPQKQQHTEERATLKVTRSVTITPQAAVVDGERLPLSKSGKALLTEIYNNYMTGYQKFHRMDLMSKLVILATELLVREQESDGESCSLILFNGSSSIISDRIHNDSIKDVDNFYPSPSRFLFTLPNISLGEAAINYNYTGETSLYILDRRDEELMQQIVESIMQCSDIKRLITGWVDCCDEECFEADLKIITK